MITEQTKKKAINFLDWAENKVPKSIEPDIKKMRNKYIYKDIGINEFQEDLTFFKCVKNLIK